MGSTTFVDGVTLTAAEWFNDLNDFSYDHLINVKNSDYGAVGDGTTDDTVAIQAAFDALSDFPAGTAKVFFPKTSGAYVITATIHIGRFSVAANDNVLGFTSVKRNVTMDLGGSIVRWNGADQPGTTKVVKTDTVGTYDLITDDDPMFSIVAGHGFTVRNGEVNGKSIDGTKRAYSCFWFQGNGNVHRFDNVTAYGARIAVREGCSWDLVGGVQYWGYADSPYYKANVYDAPAQGGWQGDTQSYTAVSLSGSMAHFSCESAQNLGVTFNSAVFGDDADSGDYGIIMAGGRLTLNGAGMLRAATYDVWMPTGSNSFTATEFHSESAAATMIRTGTGAASPNITLINSDSAIISLAGGGGDVLLVDCDDVEITRLDVSAVANITVLNSTVDVLAVTNTGAQANVNISLRNCQLTANLLTGGSAGNCYFEAHNCTPFSYLPSQAGDWSTLKENFNGQTHTAKNRISLAHGVDTLVGTISTGAVGANSMGTCLLRVNFSSPYSSTVSLGVFGLYSFAWSLDSASNVTISAVAVVQEDKALDGYASFTPVVTAVASGTSIQIKIIQTNNLTLDSMAELQAEIYEGGINTLAQVPIWTAA